MANWGDAIWAIDKWEDVMLNDVKIALRISNTAYDGEINDLILAAKADLLLSGVLRTLETDALIKRAILIYCKANFGWNNTDAEKLKAAYESLKNHLSMSLDYTTSS